MVACDMKATKACGGCCYCLKCQTHILCWLVQLGSRLTQMATRPEQATRGGPPQNMSFEDTYRFPFGTELDAPGETPGMLIYPISQNENPQTQNLEAFNLSFYEV
eukprot:m.86360 g.86360  ORF g.86360 m.86360 type:complete len:105 (-) comp13056_c0_seq5:85-399(-)